MTSQTLKLGVLVSGRGTNLQAIIDASESGKINARVVLVISDTPGVHALTRARNHKIDAVCIERESFNSRERFESVIIDELKIHSCDLICLAGFIRILGPTILHAFQSRIINIHPSLLPAFPGLDAQGQALRSGAAATGCTVHFVDEKVDHGPIILQGEVKIEQGDTAELLSERILKEEHRIYPEAIGLIANGYIK